MDLLSLRAAAVLAAVLALSGCSSLGNLRMPSMPSMPSWMPGAKPAPAAVPAAAAPAAPAAPSALQPTDRTETWQGLYRLQSGVGRFTECRSGVDKPVAQAADNALLEAAYLSTGSTPGAPLWVEVQGRWQQRARADLPPSANAQELVLLVERFVALSSRSSCAGW